MNHRICIIIFPEGGASENILTLLLFGLSTEAKLSQDTAPLKKDHA
jgi:hypothetical protein